MNESGGVTHDAAHHVLQIVLRVDAQVAAGLNQ